MVVLANFLIYFLYYFVDLGVEIFKLVMVFIVFFGMRRIVVRKSLIFNLLIWIIFSFIWCVKSQNPFFLLLYVLFIALKWIIESQGDGSVVGRTSFFFITLEINSQNDKVSHNHL